MAVVHELPCAIHCVVMIEAKSASSASFVGYIAYSAGDPPAVGPGQVRRAMDVAYPLGERTSCPPGAAIQELQPAVPGSTAGRRACAVSSSAESSPEVPPPVGVAAVGSPPVAPAPPVAIAATEGPGVE